MTDTTQSSTGAQGGAEDAVRVGQVWADNDTRAKGRTLRVLAVEHDARMGKDVALCRVLTNSDDTQQDLDRGRPWATDRRGRTTRIAVERMRPTSTGYRLVSEASA